MKCSPVAKLVEHSHRKALRILFRFHQEWWNRADENRFCDPALAVACDIARHLTSSGGVADVDGILEIKRFHQFGDVRSVRVHVMANRCLRGTAMPAPIMSDNPVAVSQEEHHLGIPVVGGERPAMVEDKWLPGSPILVENFCAVFCRDGGHRKVLLTV